MNRLGRLSSFLKNKSFISLVVTLLIVGALITAPSTEAVTVNLQVDSSGGTVTTTVEVLLDSTESIPTDNITIAITGPTNGTITLFPNGTKTSTIPNTQFTYNGTFPSLQYGSRIGYGYGYGYDFGYGYGYPGTWNGTFVITFPESQLGSGNYTFKTYVYTGRPDVHTSFTSETKGLTVTGIQHTFTLAQGWNMIGIPLNLTDNDPDTVFSGYTMWTWDASQNKYVDPSTLEVGVGYWILADNAANVTVTGTQISEMNQTLIKGWNMIGALTGMTDNDPDTVFSGYTMWTWNADTNKYVKPSTLDAGVGYWILADNAATVPLPLS